MFLKRFKRSWINIHLPGEPPAVPDFAKKVLLKVQNCQIGKQGGWSRWLLMTSDRGGMEWLFWLGLEMEIARKMVLQFLNNSQMERRR